MAKKHRLNNGTSLIGLTVRKDTMTDEDKKAKDQGLETLTKELSSAGSKLEKAAADYAEHSKVVDELKKSVEGMKEVDGETKAKLNKHAEEMASHVTEFQNMKNAIETIKKEMDQPVFRDGKDLADVDRKSAFELQERIWKHKNPSADLSEFKSDPDNLVNIADLRSASRKLLRVGLDSRDKVIRDMDEGQRKAFDAASLDSAFFMPEILGMEVDCEIECAQIWDLYNQETVSRTNFMYPHVLSYGDIGMYDCDAKCDAEFGPEGNITWQQGRTVDFRGVFCFQKKVLAEANYDLLNFMFRAAARSYRINRNDVMIRGDGVNEPRGWLTANQFPVVQSPFFNPNHQDLRQFLASAPVEYGSTTSVMHQNVFAYFAAMVDAEGRFIFGDGLMGYGPENVVDEIRISNCLPDPTEGGTKGSQANPFDAGDFIMATGVWNMAYTNVNKRPMFMEQYEGATTAWCVQYQFGAEDGGFVACSQAARVLQAGATAAP